MRVGFGDFVLDSESRELLRSGETVHLPPKAFELMALLVRERPRALAKSELLEALWPETYVAESSLFQLVTRLRAALGDDASAPRFLRTVYGYGYAFSSEAEILGEAHPGTITRHSLLWGAREFGLHDGENILGRAADAEVCIFSNRVSRHHARITLTEGRALLEDLGSKNGTSVRGRRVEEPTELASGDEVALGSIVLVYRDLSGRSTTTQLDTSRE